MPQIPLYLYVHGLLGTAWFGLVVVQATLIANRRFTAHRQLGWFGVGLMAAIVALGAYTSTHMVPRNAAAHALTEADIRLYGAVTAGDLAGFVVLPALVALAVYFRRRPDIHMRLLLIATLEMLGPAAARIGSWDPATGLAVPVVALGTIATLVAHDVWTRRRVHGATALGAAFFLAVNIGMQLSGIGQAIVAYRLAHL